MSTTTVIGGVSYLVDKKHGREAVYKSSDAFDQYAPPFPATATKVQPTEKRRIFQLETPIEAGIIDLQMAHTVNRNPESSSQFPSAPHNCYRAHLESMIKATERLQSALNSTVVAFNNLLIDLAALVAYIKACLEAAAHTSDGDARVESDLAILSALGRVNTSFHHALEADNRTPGSVDRKRLGAYVFEINDGWKWRFHPCGPCGGR